MSRDEKLRAMERFGPTSRKKKIGLNLRHGSAALREAERAVKREGKVLAMGGSQEADSPQAAKLVMLRILSLAEVDLLDGFAL